APVPAAPVAAPKLPTMPGLPKPPAPAPMAAIAPAEFVPEKETASATGTLSVPLSALSGGWPDAVKQEIAQQNLTDSSVELPMASIDSGLKTGKIIFTWGEIGAWVK